MTKSTPLARAVRTFLVGLAGFAATWATLNWTEDPVGSGTVLALNVATALVAAIAAGLLAQTALAADSAVGKAVATFCQIVGSGIAALAFNSVTDVAANGRIILTTVVAAVFAAFGSFAANAAEDIGEPAPPPAA